MANQVNLLIDQGTLFEAIADVENEDGTPYDLTGMTPYSQMRKSYYTSSYHDIGVEVEGDPLNGQIRLTFTPAQTNAIRPGRYVYDVEVHNIDSTITKRVLQGLVTISPQVTKIP